MRVACTEHFSWLEGVADTLKVLQARDLQEDREFVGQWLQGEWTRSLLMHREGGIMRVASATGVGHIGWWHWSAGGIGQVPSAQLRLFRSLARI